MSPEIIFNTTNGGQTIPEQYQCPIGWDLVTNVCTDTCGPCTTRTEDTPESVTYPSKVKTVSYTHLTLPTKRIV